MQPLLELRLEPNWQAVKASWQLCLAALEGSGLDRDQALALSIAAQELLENAVKYGDHGNKSNLELRIDKDPSEVRVQVRNPAGPPANVEELQSHLAWLSSQPDPLTAYQNRLRDLAASDPPSSGGLGLARVAYESRCALECAFDSGSVVVRAIYRF